MQIHELKRKTKLKKSRQVGRGGKRGKTSGKGTKGQNARAGRKIRPESRDTIKRFPKLRGRGKNKLTSIQDSVIPLNLAKIELAFNSGDKVTMETLISKKIVSLTKGKSPRVKILANGTLAKSLEFSGLKFSKTAKDIIEKAGGKVN